MKIIVSIICFALCLTTSTTIVYALDIFGISLGQEMKISECNKSKATIGWTTAIPEMCHEGIVKNLPYDPLNPLPVKIKMSSVESPDYLIENYITAYLIEEKIEIIDMPISPDRFDSALKAFTEKFGKPTKINTTPATNLMGATIDNVEATWELNDFSVKVTKRYSDISQGLASISSNKAVSVILNREKMKVSREKKL